MGYHGSTSDQKRKILLMLHGTLSRHHFQYDLETKTLVLHGQPHNTLCWYIWSVSSRFLLTIRKWRESQPVYFNLVVINLFLPRLGGDCAINVTGHALAWKISSVHNDSCHIERCVRSGCSQRAFPIAVFS
ncbi:hypothetical protein TNCT_707741 [Trichonephila clavata]|uniref:Uncharacterized protein n=1 Tax=Trichonephila clavata TaxID=2740835 RepID=A0A8X6GRA5_TRICU|nr:hypothetical protein TNCT_707741 [Trichonephila clavata]